MRLKSIFPFCVVAILAAAPIISAYADTRGSIHGRVFDLSGAAIAHANVSARNIVNGQVWSMQTNMDGEYDIRFIGTGHYKLTADAKGFESAVLYAIIPAGRSAEIDFHLVPSSTPTIEISAQRQAYHF